MSVVLGTCGPFKVTDILCIMPISGKVKENLILDPF